MFRLQYITPFASNSTFMFVPTKALSHTYYIYTFSPPQYRPSFIPFAKQSPDFDF